MDITDRIMDYVVEHFVDIEALQNKVTVKAWA